MKYFATAAVAASIASGIRMESMTQSTDDDSMLDENLPDNLALIDQWATIDAQYAALCYDNWDATDCPILEGQLKEPEEKMQKLIKKDGNNYAKCIYRVFEFEGVDCKTLRPGADTGAATGNDFEEGDGPVDLEEGSGSVETIPISQANPGFEKAARGYFDCIDEKFGDDNGEMSMLEFMTAFEAASTHTHMPYSMMKAFDNNVDFTNILQPKLTTEMWTACSVGGHITVNEFKSCLEDAEIKEEAEPCEDEPASTVPATLKGITIPESAGLQALSTTLQALGLPWCEWASVIEKMALSCYEK